MDPPYLGGVDPVGERAPARPAFGNRVRVGPHRRRDEALGVVHHDHRGGSGDAAEQLRLAGDLGDQQAVLGLGEPAGADPSLDLLDRALVIQGSWMAQPIVSPIQKSPPGENSGPFSGSRARVNTSTG